MNTEFPGTRTRARIAIGTLTLLVFLLCVDQLTAANWSVAPLNDLGLDTSSAGFPVSELSGVTYLGTAPIAGNHRFAAVQDSSPDVVLFDVSFTPTGTLASAEVAGRVRLDALFDFEGIVEAGASFFVSEENGPGVREYDFATGNELQSLSIPSVFTDHARANKGFESLARNAAGTKMWTANEEALTVDGPIATPMQSTLVRVQEFDVAGSDLTPAMQFAYEVDAVHEAGLGASSGLSELVALPDGTLLALERSFAAFATPTFLASIYEVDFTGADDVSQSPFDDGLDGETFMTVGKELLWSGEVGAAGGENLEGLALGPRLPNGNWVMLGIVDDGDLFSSNTIVSFEIEPMVPIAPLPDTGDFNQDGDADGHDFLVWQRGFGLAVLAALGHGDGNHDGQVDQQDFAIWQADYGLEIVVPDFDADNDVDGADFIIWQRNFGTGTTFAEGDADGSMTVDGINFGIWQAAFGQSVTVGAAVEAVPEPTTVGLLLLGAVGRLGRRRRAGSSCC